MMPIYQRINKAPFNENGDPSNATEQNGKNGKYKHIRVNTEDESMDFKNDPIDIVPNDDTMRKIRMGMIPKYHRMHTNLADDDSLDSDNDQNHNDLYDPEYVD